MNAEQARDLFSAYLEDALEPALRQQMDRTLAGNPALMQEFREFKEVCHALELTRDEEIAVPGHLNARIAAVLDDALAAKQNRPVLQLFKWKPATVSLAAGLAILAAGAAIFSPAGGKFVAGFFGSGPSEVAPVSKMSWQNDELTIQYRTAKADELLIRKGVDGEVWQTVTLGPDMVRQPIVNKTTEPLVVELDVAGTQADLPVRQIEGDLLQPLELFAGGLALLRGHRGPVSDALLEALLLDGAHVRVFAGRGLEALLLVAGKAVPVLGEGTENLALLGRQALPGRLGRARIG